jgi:hypothetical protein
MNLLSWLNTDLFSTYRDKVNEIVSGLKEGVSGQILTSAGPGNNPVWTTPALKFATINIGDWNMDTTRSVFVDISSVVSSRSKVRILSAMVRPDGDTDYNKLMPLDTVQNAAFGDFTGVNPEPQGGIDFGTLDAGSTNIVLSRKQSGFFDGTSWDSTSYNRGYLTIGYID